ncbi:MAG: MaoC family dehydratase [Trueperaceae bacterium]|jgi:acyl dehydratase|nr:MaoC family dehydratase [Truepera sp.]HRQ11662.1 MaoC family dehydratase [Trueperaceae bacterium]
MAAPSIDELQGLIGTTFGPSHRVTIDQARINAFADATLDHQWIHVDPERAATGPFGTTVAHGYLTLSLLVDMVASMDFFPAGLSLIVNYGIDRLRFPAPVPAGSTVQATAILSKLEPKGEGRWLATLTCRVEAEGASTPALVADVLYLLVA